jgi:hypothetical protein
VEDIEECLRILGAAQGSVVQARPLSRAAAPFEEIAVSRQYFTPNSRAFIDIMAVRGDSALCVGRVRQTFEILVPEKLIGSPPQMGVPCFFCGRMQAQSSFPGFEFNS